MPRPAIFDLRRRSLARANLLVAAGFLLSLLISGFPHDLRTTPLHILPLLLALLGTAETVRCMQRRWSFYHAGVILCVYTDLMAISMILFFFLYPYTHFLSSST